MTITKPVVLVASTCRWLPTARLAMAMAKAGCAVEAVCPPRHPLNKTSALQKIHPYHGLIPLQSFKAAITVTKPNLIIPGDDLATHHLHQLFRQERDHGEAGALICTLIERSLGASESFPAVYSRTKFIELAQEENIRAPRTEVIANTNDLTKWASRIGFPTALKADGASGGDGVRIVNTLAEAEHAFRALQAPPLMSKAAKRALIDQDETLVWPSLLRRRSVVNAQAFVAGREATSTIACWKGTVLASLHFEVLNKRDPVGPSTVVRLIENAEMSAVAERMVHRLNLSGLVGFDFMLEENTGNAYLIEMNPRSTQVVHLTLGPGRDLPAALHAALSGEAYQAAPKVTENDTIALFPHEWIRDPNSAFLRSGYHDVPWEEPELIQVCIRTRQKQVSLYSQRGSAEALSTVDLSAPMIPTSKERITRDRLQSNVKSDKRSECMRGQSHEVELGERI